MPLRGGLLIKVKTLTGKVRASDPRTHARAVAPAEFQTRRSTWQKRCLRAPKDGTTAHPRRVDALSQTGSARAAHGLATRQGYRVGAQTLARRLGREGVCGDGVGCHRRDSCGPCARQEIEIDIDQSDSITHIKVTAHPGRIRFRMAVPWIITSHHVARAHATRHTQHSTGTTNTHTRTHARTRRACEPRNLEVHTANSFEAGCCSRPPILTVGCDGNWRLFSSRTARLLKARGKAGRARGWGAPMTLACDWSTGAH